MALPDYAMNLSNFPEMYERLLVGPLFQPWVDVLLDRVNFAAGDRLLDIACGTGIVARVAKARLGDGGLVVGVDVSPQMLAVARGVAPGIEWREGNAGALPVDSDEKFDVVVCQQGLQFFPDKPAACHQMRAVLAPGGRLAVATWRHDDQIPFFRDLRRVAERHLGPVADQRYGFGDATALASQLTDAGFTDVQVNTVSRTIRFADGAVFVRMNTMALVGMSAGSKTMSDEERPRMVAAIVEDSAAVLSAYTQGGELAFDLSTNLATARR